jgi:hypothetical protein
MKTYNLTQHTSTQEQKDQGVVDLIGNDKEELLAILNFDGDYMESDIREAVFGMEQLMDELNTCSSEPIQFMVGGMPNLMCGLVSLASTFKMVFAQTARESVDIHMEDGSVRKASVFKHVGFSPMYVHS